MWDKRFNCSAVLTVINMYRYIIYVKILVTINFNAVQIVTFEAYIYTQTTSLRHLCIKITVYSCVANILAKYVYHISHTHIYHKLHCARLINRSVVDLFGWSTSLALIWLLPCEFWFVRYIYTQMIIW